MAIIDTDTVRDGRFSVYMPIYGDRPQRMIRATRTVRWTVVDKSVLLHLPVSSHAVNLAGKKHPQSTVRVQPVGSSDLASQEGDEGEK